MNKVINEAYKNYDDSHTTFLNGFAMFKPMAHSKETFINECKSNEKFAKKWGLKIYERELSLEERKIIYEKEFTPGIEIKNDVWLESKLKTRNIRTKKITIIYNNQKTEIYE